MTTDQADMLNKLMDVENEIAILWEYHPDNPNQINVEDRFEELQKLVVTIETYLEEKGIDIEEENELPF
jgi:hypothetical protein